MFDCLYLFLNGGGIEFSSFSDSHRKHFMKIAENRLRHSIKFHITICPTPSYDDTRSRDKFTFDCVG